jgi:peptidoglycan/xylan/chitin deacetylase (PgdA/CDA1 family)
MDGLFPNANALDREVTVAAVTLSMADLVHHWCMRDDLLRQVPPPIEEAKAPRLGRPSRRPYGTPLLRAAIRSGLMVADETWWRFSQRLVHQKPSLVAIALHSLCPDRSQVEDPTLAPNQNISVLDFRDLVDTLLEDGYTAVSPAQVGAGLDPGGKFVMITFDDGYYNNVLALDVLKEYEVPATFFVSSNHVLEGKAFWWDAFNRELVKVGATEHQRNVEIARIKDMSASHIEAYLQRLYGVRSLQPLGDTDRPFNRAELAEFSRLPWVHLGNHTCDHAILTRCSREEMRYQIEDCQRALTEIAGAAPLAIAYPNGNCSPEVVAAAQAAGLRVGITARPSRNLLPLECPLRLMNLGRFYFCGDHHPRDELLKWHVGSVPSYFIKRALGKAP